MPWRLTGAIVALGLATSSSYAEPICNLFAVVGETAINGHRLRANKNVFQRVERWTQEIHDAFPFLKKPDEIALKWSHQFAADLVEKTISLGRLRVEWEVARDAYKHEYGHLLLIENLDAKLSALTGEDHILAKMQKLSSSAFRLSYFQYKLRSAPGKTERLNLITRKRNEMLAMLKELEAKVQAAEKSSGLNLSELVPARGTPEYVAGYHELFSDALVVCSSKDLSQMRRSLEKLHVADQDAMDLPYRDFEPQALPPDWAENVHGKSHAYFWKARAFIGQKMQEGVPAERLVGATNEAIFAELTQLNKLPAKDKTPVVLNDRLIARINQFLAMPR